ncbi:MAG: AtpZ/AtpI family protein [SAR202 cluster bacterium]|nr:AtpZ/AtpI family protein [SAR202 cluster bacterium]
MQTLTRLIGLGWLVALSIVSGIMLGVWIDGELGSSPLFMLIGLALGIGVAALGAYRVLSSFLNR